MTARGAVPLVAVGLALFVYGIYLLGGLPWAAIATGLLVIILALLLYDPDAQPARRTQGQRKGRLRLVGKTGS